MIDCGYQGCFDRTLHTFARYEECILDKGGTKSEARRLWDAQIEKDRVDLSVDEPRPSSAPVYCHPIECHYDGCKNSGHHSLDQLIGCIVAAGRPFLDAIRCWNHHVPAKYKVPVSAFQPPAAPDAPHAVAAPPPTSEPVAPISDSTGSNPGVMLPVLYKTPVDIDRLARVYSYVFDVGGLMSYKHGYFNEAVNQNPHVGKINCRNVDCHKQSLHTFTDFLECSITAGDFLDEAAARWSMSEPSEEQTPFCFSVIPKTPYQKYRESPEYLDTLKPPPFDWYKSSPEFRNAFILRHGRDGRVMMSTKQAMSEFMPVRLSYDRDRVEKYSNTGKMKYVSVIRKGGLASTSYEHGMIMVGSLQRYGYCMHMITDGCLHANGTRVSRNRRLNCGRVLCAECLLPMCNKTAARALARLSAMMLRLRAGIYITPDPSIFIHGAYSLSEEHCKEFETKKGRKRVYARFIREVKRLGFVGGVYIIHPWRFEDNLEGGKWSVHIHFIAAGFVDHNKYRVKNAKAIMAGKMSTDPMTDLIRRTGDMYIPIRNFPNFGDAFDTLAYTLSHAGVEATGGQILKYFGEAAPNKFGTQDVESNNAGVDKELESRSLAMYEVEFGKRIGKFKDGKVVTYYVKSDYMDVDLKRLGKPVVQKLKYGDLQYLLNSIHGTSKRRSLQGDNPANPASTGVEKGGADAVPYRCDCGNSRCKVPLPKEVCDCKAGICDCLEDGSVPFVHAVPEHTVNAFAVVGLRYKLHEKLDMDDDDSAVSVDKPPGPGPPAVEYATKEFVVHFNPSMSRLCPQCCCRKKVILPRNGILRYPYDPETAQQPPLLQGR